jgi:two-component system, OmpR family, sensor histidine kinase CpxA
MPGGLGGPEPGNRLPTFKERTNNPTRYWIGMRVPLFEPGERRPSLAILAVASDSMSGHGLFFDIRPWLLVASAIVLLSGLIWFPFVRGLTRSIGQMTSATEDIARGRFDARVGTLRTDELGRLAGAIDKMSGRLKGFVGGQRRFLGDIAHELNSPLARMDVALGILEERLGNDQLELVADVQEEVRLMSDLVGELLAFARADLKGPEPRLGPVPLRPLADTVAAREASGHDLRTEIPDDCTARAHPQLLGRALANVIRNAVRYAGDAGPIAIRAATRGGQVELVVSDAGPGVPPEALSRLFDPFFRIEADRARATGGAGLGLAIVKTCVEAMKGTVTARNASPGFEVRIVLPAA